MGQTRPLLFIFVLSHDQYSTNTINDKSIDVVLGTFKMVRFLLNIIFWWIEKGFGIVQLSSYSNSVTRWLLQQNKFAQKN